MKNADEEIRTAVKAYVLDEFLPGEDPAALNDATPLISGGILDSISTLKLVAFLEDRYGIELAAHEADIDHLDTVARIAALVLAKTA